MPRCQRCGNDYDKTFEVRMGTETHVFDSFECAIQTLAPSCSHCGLRIIGHGVETANTMFCSAHCARESGVGELHDRA